MSFLGGESVIAYSAAKGAIAQMTKCLCNEWAARGVNVNAIAPGFMETGLNKHIINGKNPERHAKIAERIPAGRWGTPDDTKYLAVFLASSASDYLHGAIVPCDGGYLSK
jgi:2-deoxy-D-gluconate 3-dehydrogenase